MALTAKLELRQGQQLVMTPQLQQAIRMLQLSNLELSQFVEGELERAGGPLELPRALEPEIREALVARLRAVGYQHVTLDLRGYRLGSLNEGLRLQPT